MGHVLSADSYNAKFANSYIKFSIFITVYVLTFDFQIIKMSGEKVNIKIEDEGRIKVYKRRWIVLLIYILYSAINALQWIQYAIISNIIMKYYNISSVSVDWTSIIYMALYTPLVLPASYVVDKMVSIIVHTL